MYFTTVSYFVSVSIFGSHLFVCLISEESQLQLQCIGAKKLSVLSQLSVPFFPCAFQLTIFNIMYLMVPKVLIEKKGGESNLIHAQEV